MELHSSVTIIIPTLNEEENIEILLDRLVKLYPKINILVVDDGSSDNTQQVVKEKSKVNDSIRLIDRSNKEEKGLTISIRDGILNVDTKWFMNMDGDLQHPPESIKIALGCISNDPEVIIGRRDHVENWPFTRKLISWGAQTLGRVSLFLRRKPIPKDIMSGYFGGKTQFYKELLKDDSFLEKGGYKFLFDMLKIIDKNTKVCEFGYIFKNRAHGSSKIGKKQILAFAKSLF